MIRPISKNRPVQFLNDFQVLKGNCEKTMKPFGQPVAAAYEARLMIRDDQEKNGQNALYVIHQRSENRIVHIVEPAAVTVMKARDAQSRFPLPKAA
jgi:hypothetical protein